MRYLIILTAIFLSFMKIFAASNAVFSGLIKDFETKKTIPGVTILIEGRAYGAISKKDGSFEIKGLANGNYTAVFSMVGYKPYKFKFNVTDNNKNIILNNVELVPTIIETAEIIVSANKKVQAVQEVPISVAVINSKELLERNINVLDDALRYVPGININFDHISIRGTSGFAFGLGSRVQVLLDGFPMISADNGDIKFDALPMFNVDRIEIVKGAGSALYGTGALGGVINIITENPSENADIRIKTYAGFYTNTKYKQWNYSNETKMKYGVDLSYAKKFGNLGLLLSGDVFSDDSYRKYDKMTNYNTYAKVNYSINEYSKLSINGSASLNEHDDWVYWNSLDSATIPPSNTDYNNKINSDKYSLSAAFTHIFNDGNFLKINSGAFITKLENHPKVFEEYRESSAFSINTEAQMNTIFNKIISLTYGLNHGYNNVNSKIFGIHSQNIFSGYVQTELNPIDELIGTIGARIDYEQTDKLKENYEFSPKIGLSYRTDFGLNLRASIGKGFRTATVAERFAAVQFSGFTIAENPSIMPEYSWSYEIGAIYDLLDIGLPIQLDASIFQNDLYDLIEPTFVESSGAYKIKFLNVTRAKIQGIEINIKAMPANYLGLETAITLMNPIDLTLNETLKYRSKLLWYNRIYIPINYIEIQADYRYLSKIINLDERLGLPGGIKDADARVPGHIIDARILFYLEKLDIIPITFSINVNNLFNYYYTEIPGNLAPTRHISINAMLKI